MSESSWLTLITFKEEVRSEAIDLLTFRKAGWISFQLEDHSEVVVCDGSRNMLKVLYCKKVCEKGIL